MRYTHFEIKNFKGIRSLRLDLNTTPRGKIHTLVGLNESGKTTILEAIDYFIPSDEALDPKNLGGRIRQDQHDLIPVASRANFNGETTISAGFELDDSDIRALKKYMRTEYGYTLGTISNQITITDKYEFKNSKYLDRGWSTGNFIGTGKGENERKYWPFQYSSRNKKYWQAAAAFLRERVPPIWYFPNFLFEFPERFYLSKQENEPSSSSFYRALLQDILSSVDGEATIEEHILERANSEDESDSVALEQLMLDMGRTVTRDVFTAWDQLFNQRVNKEVNLRIQTDEQGDKYVEFRIVDSDGYFFIRERSLGFRWFFVFLLLTKYRGFRENSTTEMIFLFDEPASNLHSTAQERLLQSLAHLAESYSIIYTTHSQHLINPVWLENTHVVRNAGNEANADDLDYNAHKTDIQIDRYRAFASEHPSQSRFFQPILDVLEYRPSQLELVPDVVMLEGKNDFYALKYFQSVVLNRETELHCLPGNGAGTLELPIRLYLGWARNFIVMLDSDSEGETQKERYQNIFGVVLNDRVFSLDELSSIAADSTLEDMFEESDKLAIQGTVYPGEPYKKKHFWRALQELLAAGQKIPISEYTVNRFSDLLDSLEGRLSTARP